MKWPLAAAVVIMALTYCIEATVDDNANVLSSTQDSQNILAIKGIIDNRERVNLNANSGDLIAQQTDELDINNSYSFLKERSDENLNYINDQKNSLTTNLANYAYTAGLIETLNTNPNNGSFFDEKAHAHNDSKNEASFGSSNAASNINSKLEYLYEKSHVDRTLGGKDLVASQDAASNLNSKMGYLFENMRSGQDNMDQVQTASSNVRSGINSKIGYVYESRMVDKKLKAEQTASSNIASKIDSRLEYIYDNSRPDDNSGKKFLIANTNIGSNADSKHSNIDEMGNYKKNSSASGKILSRQEIVSLLNSNLEHISTQNDPRNILLSGEISVENWFNIEGLLPFEPNIYFSGASKDLSIQWDKKTTSRTNSHRNYAVVIGINNYDDHKGLHASVNDAKDIGSILKSLGYEVITLTDEAEIKPTKHNILDGALKEISLKKDRGNVVLYFSGHGEVDNEGNFYIIPRDGKGDKSSYISQDEVNQYLKGIKNLAVIIDACNSGAFKSAADNDQLILTSSKENEPSNENWTAPVSVFTYYLCQSIEEDNRANKGIIMQEAFSRAYNETLMWSSTHLVRQTPCFVDTTKGKYYLN
jgi:hypothetical protein